jgi:hypothetical protein
MVSDLTYYVRFCCLPIIAAGGGAVLTSILLVMPSDLEFYPQRAEVSC